MVSAIEEERRVKTQTKRKQRGPSTNTHTHSKSKRSKEDAPEIHQFIEYPSKTLF